MAVRTAVVERAAEGEADAIETIDLDGQVCLRESHRIIHPGVDDFFRIGIPRGVEGEGSCRALVGGAGEAGSIGEKEEGCDEEDEGEIDGGHDDDLITILAPWPVGDDYM